VILTDKKPKVCKDFHELICFLRWFFISSGVLKGGGNNVLLLYLSFDVTDYKPKVEVFMIIRSVFVFIE